MYNYSGNHELAGTKWQDDDGYSSNGVFLYVHEDEYCDSYSGSCTHGKTFFQREGSLYVTSAEFNTTNSKMTLLSATLTGVVLEEVSINSIGRECIRIKDATVEYHGYYY